MPVNVKNSFIALKSGNFRKYFFGQTISLCGTWMQQMAMSWLTYRLTGSTALMGIVLFLTQAPSLLISPAAGARADRMDKRRALIVIQSAFVLQAGALGALTLAGLISAPLLLLVSLIQGLITAYDFPFRQSLVPEMLDNREHLQNAIAVNSLVVNTARIIGPSFAGILVASVGEGWCFLLNSISYLGAVIALLSMKMKYMPAAQSGKSKKYEDVRAGFVYVWKRADVRGVMAMLLVASFIGTSYMTLLPALVKDALHGSAQSMGFLMAFTGVGAIVSAVFLALRSSAAGLDKMIGYAVFLGGSALALLGGSGSIGVAYSVMPFVGMALTFQMASSNTYVQTVSDSRMRGRVMGIYALIWNGISPFGNLLYGFMAEYIGTKRTITGGGLFMICAAAAYLIWKRGKQG